MTADTPPAGAPHRSRRLLDRRPWLREVGIFAAALLVYQVSRALVIGDAPTAFKNAWDIVMWEKGAGLFWETGIQGRVLESTALTTALNHVYLYAHWTVTPLVFVWLYRSRADWYPFVRNGFLAANAIAVTFFVAYPVAPPRLLTGAGVVDTLNVYSDIDLHGGRLAGWFNPYAAVPSMHFGYALMIGVVGFVLVRVWWVRVAALGYPVLVFLTITATGNHFILDSAIGGLVMVAGFSAVVMYERVREGAEWAPSEWGRPR
jgi:hypothetical protein